GRERLPGLHDLARLRPGPLEHVRRDPADRRGAEREARDHAEVPAAAAATGPEEIRVVSGIAAEHLARGGDDRQADERVARKPELAHRVAVAAAERETGDADRGARSRRDRQPVRGERRVDIGEKRPAPTLARPGPSLTR